MNRLLTATAITLSLSMPLVPGHAQDSDRTDGRNAATGQQDQDRSQGIKVIPEARVDLGTWGYDELYADGWRAERLLDADVYGMNGEEIGEIENIVVGPDDRVHSVIIEAGGFLDIGDTHLRVPWDEVTIGNDPEQVTVPVTEETVDDYGLFGNGEIAAVPEEYEARPQAWKVTDLIGDYARLGNGEAYGWVGDLIFDRSGMLRAVVVSPDIRYGVGGPYAYPWYGYPHGWTPAYAYYDLPYGIDEVSELEPFDYGSMGGSDGTQ